MFLTYLLYAVAAVAIGIVLLAIVVALRPNDFRVSRSIKIAAPQPQVFAHVNDLHKWEAWSPWAKLDPAMKQTYEGASEGVGASYTWNGNSNVGEGRNTITESRPSELIRLKLEFVRPFKGTNEVEFTFQAAGDQTIVTWLMLGKLNFITKAMGLVMSMEKMCGGQFEQGLSQMKAVVEKESAAVTAR